MSLRPRTDRRQGILPFVLKLAERDDVTARAGLPLVVETNRALGLDGQARHLFGPPQRREDFGADEQLETLSTLIAGYPPGSVGYISASSATVGLWTCGASRRSASGPGLPGWPHRVHSPAATSRNRPRNHNPSRLAANPCNHTSIVQSLKLQNPQILARRLIAAGGDRVEDIRILAEDEGLAPSCES